MCSACQILWRIERGSPQLERLCGPVCVSHGGRFIYQTEAVFSSHASGTMLQSAMEAHHSEILCGPVCVPRGGRSHSQNCGRGQWSAGCSWPGFPFADFDHGDQVRVVHYLCVLLSLPFARGNVRFLPHM